MRTIGKLEVVEKGGMETIATRIVIPKSKNFLSGWEGAIGDSVPFQK